MMAVLPTVFRRLTLTCTASKLQKSGPLMRRAASENVFSATAETTTRMPAPSAAMMYQRYS